MPGGKEILAFAGYHGHSQKRGCRQNTGTWPGGGRLSGKAFQSCGIGSRVKSHIQIHERLLEHREQQKVDAIIVKNLAIRPKERRVYLNGEEMNLANKEFEVLLFLAENPNIVFSKDTLFDRIWGMDSVGNTATVTVHINRLREKLEKNADSSPFIETVWGAGYRFKVE